MNPLTSLFERILFLRRAEESWARNDDPEDE
jgi:hypothetical protein